MISITFGVMTLSAIGIGLNLVLLPILKYTTKYNAVESFVVAILIFCPLLYNLLSIGKLTLNGLYLYSLLAIIIYTYVSKKIGSAFLEEVTTEMGNQNFLLFVTSQLQEYLQRDGKHFFAINIEKDKRFSSRLLFF